MQIKHLQKQIYQINRYICNTENAGEKALYREKTLNHWRTLKAKGADDITISKALNVSRATFYNWQKAYKSNRILGLKPKSCRPKTYRQSKISLHIKQRVFHLRKAYPMWGKEKLARILQKEGHEISPSSVGRILRGYFERNVIKRVPELKAISVKRRRRHFTKHAKRWLYKMKAKSAGELIQIDHMSVTTASSGRIKHFMATCPITKITVSEAYNNATSKTASIFLQKVIKELPFKVISIQVDGGSEFMKHFEESCQDCDIDLFVLPPRSPKYNGCIERTNGSFRYEFYHTEDDSYNLPTLRKNLELFTKLFNQIRPHQSLDYMTPMEYYSNIYLKKTA